jgi:hypothetical protein
LKGFVDDDWANDPTHRKLCTGFVYMLGGEAISWESRKKERGVAEFSTEAEYVTHAKASNEDIYLQNFLTELFGNFYSVTLFC